MLILLGFNGKVVVTFVVANIFELGLEEREGWVLTFGINTGWGKKLVLLLIELI